MGRSTGPVFAIVGAGPSGFYAAEALLRAVPDCRVHLIERAPAPHGLVRYGVAPDHQKLKQVAAVFDEIASDDRVALHAGVEVGRDLTLGELRAHCDAVVLATGSAVGRPIGVPGETLRQVVSSAAFVGWYNGHPDHVALAPDLAVASAVIVGHGNVSLDVCRLLVRDLADLEASDIPEPMLEAFRRRRLREVHLLGRGGPGDVKFGFKAFRQLADLPQVRVCLPQRATFEDDAGRAGPDAARVAQWLKANAAAGADTDDDRRVAVRLWFHVVPAAFLGEGHVNGVFVRPSASHRPTAGDAAGATLPCGLAVSCVGYACERLAGVPAYSAAGIVENEAGQVVDGDGCEVPGLFVAGWAKRGPTGVIGTNRADADETVRTLLQRLSRLRCESTPPPIGDLATFFGQRGIPTLTHADWRVLDRLERAAGEVRGKPREKLLSIDAARAALLRRPVTA